MTLTAHEPSIQTVNGRPIDAPEPRPYPSRAEREQAGEELQALRARYSNLAEHLTATLADLRTSRDEAVRAAQGHQRASPEASRIAQACMDYERHLRARSLATGEDLAADIKAVETRQQEQAALGRQHEYDQRRAESRAAGLERAIATTEELKLQLELFACGHIDKATFRGRLTKDMSTALAAAMKEFMQEESDA